jgi:hypothetical protein
LKYRLASLWANYHVWLLFSSDLANYHVWLLFSLDLALQESLYSEYKKSCPSLQAVRVGHTGREGRHAVIYFASMGDARKALDDTRLRREQHKSNGGFFGAAEASLYLADEEVVDEK